MENKTIELFMNKLVDYLKKGYRGLFAIADQGLYSGTNFLVNILFARMMTPDDFGLFVLSFSIIVVFQQIYSSIILEPMSVLGAKHSGQGLNNYIIGQFKLQFIFTVLTGLVIIALLGGINALVPQSPILDLLILWGIFLPINQLLFFMRRAYYILQRPGVSAFGSMLYSIVLVGCTYLISKSGYLTPKTAVLFFAIASLVGSVLIVNLLKADKSSKSSPPLVLLRQNWAFGKWFFLSSVLVGTALQSQVYLSGGLLGIEEAGIVKVLQSFIQPVTLTFAAIASYSLPIISADFAKKREVEAKKKVVIITAIQVFVAVVFEIVLIFAGEYLEALIYRGQYAQYVGLLPIWGIIPIFLALSNGISLLHYAAQKSQALLYSSLVWMVMNFGVGSLLISRYNLYGASYSAVLGYLSTTIVFGILYWLWFMKPSKEGSHPHRV